jgi:outer membrane receptor for ferrienterochelin and colicin
VTLGGFIEDAETGEYLANVAFREVEGKAGGVTNAHGFFSVTLPAGEYRFTASHVGYVASDIPVRLQRDTVIRVRLLPGTRLEEVTVYRGSSLVQSSDLGKHGLPVRQLQVMPALLGEPDILKALQHLPGVNPGTEGMAGFSVRGGSPEQTAVLLDGMPVYNVNHAFGYFSVFNGEALKDVTLLKGGIPARHGGRLSSVLDVTMKEGNNREFTGNLALSPVAGALTVEGPIKREKASFILSGRRTWLDGFLRLGQRLAGSEFLAAYGFYDLTAKINWKAGERDRFFLSFYAGRDGLTVTWNASEEPGKYRYSWGNASVAARWHRVLSPRAFNNTTLYYSRFNYRNEVSQYRADSSKRERSAFGSTLEEVALKSDFDLIPGDSHHARYGMLLSKKYLAPEASSRSLLSTSATWQDETTGDTWSVEGYAEDEWRVGARWVMSLGTRGTLLFTGNARYASVEPRAAVAYLFSSNTSLKASFSFMQQPLHLLANSSLAWKTDMWVPASDQVRPGRSRLYSLGAYHATRDGIEFSAGVYYNDLRRVIRYRDGIGYLKQKEQSWQEYVHVGDGRAYGVEFMVNKPAGALNGWVAYTLSRAERRFNGIAGNAWFPFEYDRRHKVDAVATYTFPGRERARFQKVIAVNFTGASGNYTTIGDETYPGLPMPWEKETRDGYWNRPQEYIPRPNNVRLPAYHHLDVVLHLQNRSDAGGSWSFGVYNIYARQNPGFYYRKWESETGFSLKKVSLLPFMPVISWSYRFKK